MKKRLIILFFILSVSVLSIAEAAVNVKTIPPPAPTTKLRLYVHLITIVSSEIRHGAGWQKTDEDYLANQINYMEKFGIYEVISPSDVKAAIGDQNITYGEMERNDWGLAREIGKGLHADYVLITTRKMQKGMTGVERLFEAVMINTENGKYFRISDTLEKATKADIKEMGERNREMYRKIFNLAKEDLFAVAMKKGKAFVPKSPAPPMKPEPAAAAPSPGEAAKNLLVFDFAANEQYQTAAIILAEALREELLAMKKVALVDRNDLQKVRKKAASQGMELIDDKQAVSMAKEISADQFVTGRLALDGEEFVVQAKRTSVDAGTALGRASLTFKAGQEGEVMKKLPGFAKELMAL
jgi:hypothetical protein